MGGQVITNAQESSLSSEAVGLMIAALVLVLTFGTLVAAGLPIVTALFGLGISSAAVGLLAAVMDVPDWSTAVASMIGLGVGIDYALLILTRHRAALATGLEPRAAAVEAVSTAGHSVLIAGTTVVISLLGLFLMGLSYLQGVALSASFAVLVTMAASVTLLPALLGFAGTQDRPAADPRHRPQRGRRPRHDARRALEPRRPAPPVGRRDRGRRGAARAGDAVPRPAPRLPRRRQRPGGDHHPPGLRPRVQGLRRRRQRPAPARGRAARARRQAPS